MDSVGAEAFGKADVVVHETGAAARLDQIDQVADMIFVRDGTVHAKQNAGSVGAVERARQLRFELCRRLCGKLEIEPARMLDFSHVHGLSAASLA
jgi:hypothetical protein